nr:MAG: C-5 cytosine-specific DNA methylase [Bacteriophage sp.]
MNVLIACEESQEVCRAFRAKGHEAYSCDIQECSGGHPEWHIKDDVTAYLNGKHEFTTQDGKRHRISEWDLIIAHPPCTYLSCVTTRHLSLRCNSAQKVVDRMWNLAKAAVFFMQCYFADCKRVAVENPSGFMSTLFKKPDCTIHPYYFAESEKDVENYQKKRTCFWLRGLEPLERTSELPPPPPLGFTKSGKPLNFAEMGGKIAGLQHKGNAAAARSKTFPGIAKAMAEQWGDIKED